MLVARSAILIGALVWHSVALAQGADSVLAFEVPVVPQTERYIDLLAAPAYVALALENNDLKPSFYSQLLIYDRQTVQLGPWNVRFMGRRGTVFAYEVKVRFMANTFVLVVELDTEPIRRGFVTLRVMFRYNKYIPHELREKMQYKLREIAHKGAQERVIGYLDAIREQARTGGEESEVVLEAIAFDAYNRLVRAKEATRSAKEATRSAIEENPFLVFLVLWLAGYPLFLLGLRIVEKRRTRG